MSTHQTVFVLADRLTGEHAVLEERSRTRRADRCPDGDVPVTEDAHAHTAWAWPVSVHTEPRLSSDITSTAKAMRGP